MKSIDRKLRVRQSVNLGKKQITDQSYKKMCCINSIVANYQKTGILSHQKQKIAQYIDNTKIPSLMDAQELLRDAKESFLALPSQIRKLMDHDPTKLVEFIQNQENQELLVKHGIIELREKVEPKNSADPTKAKPALEKTQEE